MRIFTLIAVSVAILLGAATDTRAGQSPGRDYFNASGRVIDVATGEPISNVKVELNTLWMPAKAPAEHPHGSQLVEGGEFRFTNLWRRGRYAVYLALNNGSEYCSERVVFDVGDSDVTGLEIKASRAASLSGEVVIESAHDPSILSDLSMGITIGRLSSVRPSAIEGAHDPSSLSELSMERLSSVRPGAFASVRRDRSFHISGLPPGKYRLALFGRPFNPHSINQRWRLSLLSIERDGVWLSDSIEVAAGEQVTGLRLVGAYGPGVVRGQVEIVGGTLPEGASLSVSARRADLAGRPSSVLNRSIDERGLFLIQGLATGVYEISLMVFVPSPAGETLLSPLRPPVRQTVSVTSGAGSEVTLVLDLKASGVKEEKR
jgi:hypothetical protein